MNVIYKSADLRMIQQLSEDDNRHFGHFSFIFNATPHTIR